SARTLRRWENPEQPRHGGEVLPPGLRATGLVVFECRAISIRNRGLCTDEARCRAARHTLAADEGGDRGLMLVGRERWREEDRLLLFAGHRRAPLFESPPAYLSRRCGWRNFGEPPC